MESEEGKGSTFTFLIPLEKTDFSSHDSLSEEEDAPEGLTRALPFRPKVKGNTDNLPFAKPNLHTTSSPFPKFKYDHLRISDDRNTVKKGEGYILIVEDDTAFAEVLYHQVKDHGLKSIHAPIAQEAIDQIRKSPPSAVFLDINLPDMDGRSVLKVIKEDLDLRHIPVQILSADESGMRTVDIGALGFLQKPVNPDSLSKVFDKMVHFSQGESRKLLFLEQDEEHVKILTKLLEDKDVVMTRAEDVEDACSLLKHETFDCMILDLRLQDEDWIQPLIDLNKREDFELPPAIILTEDEEAAKSEPRLKSLANSFILKGSSSSADRLLDESALFLHRVVKTMSDHKRDVLQKLHESERFDGKKVLLVDDDHRNLLVLLDVLEEKGFTVIEAENGLIALAQLGVHSDVDLVLMDIMMPEMDGYEATRQIRKNTKWRDLPILALTAKAMSTDRAKCIEAGANDYLTKPIDIPRLFSLIRAWIRNR